MSEKELDSLLKNVDSLIEEYESKKNELDKEIKFIFKFCFIFSFQFIN